MPTPRGPGGLESEKRPPFYGERKSPSQSRQGPAGQRRPTRRQQSPSTPEPTISVVPAARHAPVQPGVAGGPSLPRRGLTQARWLTLPGEHPDAAVLRSDYRANMLAVARAIGWAADWETLRSRPTMARIIELTGLSERTCQRWCRWLEHRRLLEVLTEGSTPQFRAGILYGEGGNQAREWRLTDPSAAPSVYLAGTPSGNLFCLGRSTPDARNPQTKRLTEKGWAAEVRQFRAALWTPADLDHAVQCRPDGSRWAMDDPVRHPRAHLRWRLSWWLDERGSPLPSPSQRRAAGHVRVLAEQARRRAERRPPSGYEAGAALARRLLAARPARDASPSSPATPPPPPAAPAALPRSGRGRPGRGG